MDKRSRADLGLIQVNRSDQPIVRKTSSDGGGKGTEEAGGR